MNAKAELPPSFAVIGIENAAGAPCSACISTCKVPEHLTQSRFDYSRDLRIPGSSRVLQFEPQSVIVPAPMVPLPRHIRSTPRSAIAG